MAEQFQRETQTDDFSIQSYNFGGLNTTASRLNVPFSDATELVNVNVGLDGSLLKRKGTRKVSNLPTVGVNYGVGIRSVLGYSYSVVAGLTDITVSSRKQDTMTVERNFSLVYNTSGVPPQEPVQWIQLPDTYTRVLALRGDRPPVEVYLIEERVGPIVYPAINTISVGSKFVGDHKSLTPATFRDTIYLTRQDGTRFEFTGGTLTYIYNPGTNTCTVTIPFTLLSNETITFDVVGFRWCWWTESLYWQGDRLYDSLSRFNVTANDNQVPVPLALRSDSRIGEESLVLSVSKTSSTADNYTLVNQPTTADQYNTSDGSVYVPGVNNFLQQSPAFITFGTARTPLPQPPESIKVLRYRELRFNQRGQILANDLRVTVNEVVRSCNYSNVLAGVQQYQLYTKQLALVTNNLSTAAYIGFSGSVPMGVGVIDSVTLTNVASGTNLIGTVALEFEESGFQSGAYRRAYGLGLFCDYSSRVYPSVGCVYQGRLVLGGIRTDKSRVIISSVDPALDRYSFFQITDDLAGLATDPFDVVVSGGDSADFIVGLVEWNNSLFVLTRRSVYRVSGGDQPLTATRRLVTYISNIGLVNSRCLVRTDTAVYYLSDGGVFNLTPRVENSEFSSIEKSLKIRDLVLSRPTDSLVAGSSLFFDNRQRRLHLALPNRSDLLAEASDLYVLDTVRDAWTSYNALGQFRVQSMYETVDNTSGRYSLVACCGGIGNVLLDSDTRFTDMTTSYTGGTTYTHNFTMGYGVPSLNDVQRYSIPDGIPYSGVSTIRDLRVFVGTNSTPTEVRFTKFSKYVYLDVPTVAGQTVWFVCRSPVNDSPQGLLRYGTGDRYPYTLWQGNVDISPANEVLTFNTVTRRVNLAVTFTGVPSDLFLIGTHYYTSYVSSMFTQQQLGTLKRTKHAYLYFNNGDPANYSQGTTIEAYSTRVNANVAMYYDSDDSEANTSVDLYGYQDIVWDNAYFDTVESSDRQEQFVLFKEPLIGIGYSYRLGVYSYDDARWNLVGYQIDASRNKGLRYISSK